MKFRVVMFITLFLLMLVTGVFWGTWFTLTRSLPEFSSEEFMHIGKVIIANVAMPMRVIFPACVLFMILYLWWYPVKSTQGFYWAWAALIFTLATLAITLIVLVPIDNEIKQWTTATVPGNWVELRTRWDIFHAARTATSLAGFFCFSISVVSKRSKKWHERR